MFFFFQAEDGIRDTSVTGVQTCALPISGIPTGEREGIQRHRVRFARAIAAVRSNPAVEAPGYPLEDIREGEKTHVNLGKILELNRHWRQVLAALCHVPQDIQGDDSGEQFRLVPGMGHDFSRAGDEDTSLFFYGAAPRAYIEAARGERDAGIK